MPTTSSSPTGIIPLDFALHPKQAEIFQSSARFKVVSAGRRGGKTYLSAVMLLIEGLRDFNDKGQSLLDKRVFYVAPTFDQGKRIIWDLLKDLGKGVIKSTLENQAVLTLINGRKIEIKGADRPDSLRGVGLSYVVMDEYAFMKPDVWEKILRPTLTDVTGNALFIGTPEGKNHFYDLYMQAGADETGAMEAFTFCSLDNPTIDPEEVEEARRTLSASVFRQEYEASFSASGGAIFQENMIKYVSEEPELGTWYIAVDPAGYKDLAGVTQSKINSLDECAIACVKVGPYGWYVGEIIHGRWGIRKTATQILRAAQKYKALTVGIEGGSLKNAIMPYLQDEMMRLQTFPNVREVTHGNQRKIDRITWALQGRFEHERIMFQDDKVGNHQPWNREVETQLLDFPNPLTHDDLIDALSYIDQVAKTDWEEEDEDPDWERPEDVDDDNFEVGPDPITGY